MTSHVTSVDHAVLKASTAIGGAGGAHALAGTELAQKTEFVFPLSTWADAAALMAFIYSACLFLEWLWKKVGRPIAERHGWVKRLKRRAYDAANHE